MSKLIVDSDLNVDSTGAIRTYFDNDIEGRKQMVALWFATAANSVPFLNFGNSINEWIFSSMNIPDIEGKIGYVVQYIRTNFGLDIIDEQHVIDKDKKRVTISMTLQNGYSYDLKI